MNAKMEAAVRNHGEILKAMFGIGPEVDPVNLCRKLRRVERAGAAFGLRLCNGPEFPSEAAQDREHDRILRAFWAVVGFQKADVPVFLNQDPRGYALKVKSEWTEAWNAKRGDKPRLYCDWGGYGIIAPDLTYRG